MAYVAGCAVGGGLTGLVVGLVSAATRSAPGGSVVVVALAAALAALATWCEARGRMRPLPERRKQVPRRWLMWRRTSVTGAAFGLMIGSGVLTHVRHAAAYALVALALLATSVGAAAAVGAAYGLARGATLAAVWAADRLRLRRPAWPESAAAERMTERALAAAVAASTAAAMIIVI